MHNCYRKYLTAFAVPVAVLTFACGSDLGGPPDPVVRSLVVVQGANQTGVVYSALDEPVTFQTASPDGDPFPATIVVTLLEDDYIRNDSIGRGVGGVGQSLTFSETTSATVEWRLGAGIGGHRLRAIAFQPSAPDADTLEVVVTATAVPDELSNVVQLGNNQVGNAGEALPLPLGVELTDKYGSPYWDVVVTWSVTAGDGTLSAETTQSDWWGRATVEWTLGPSAGTQTVIATVEDVGEVLFTATAR